MSEPLKEGTDRTWRVAEKERRESKYRTKQVFIEHATDKSRKQEKEIKHTAKSNLPAFVRKVF